VQLGVPGATGATRHSRYSTDQHGPSYNSTYASVSINTSANTPITVNSGEYIPFATTNSLKNAAKSSDNISVSVNGASAYLVQFTINVNQGDTAKFQIYQNGSAINDVISIGNALSAMQSVLIPATGASDTFSVRNTASGSTSDTGNATIIAQSSLSIIGI
jgi:hypothetical protein